MAMPSLLMIQREMDLSGRVSLAGGMLAVGVLPKAGPLGDERAVVPPA